MSGQRKPLVELHALGTLGAGGKVLTLPMSMGVPRTQMPQIKSEFVPDFLEMLKKNGVSVKQGERRVGDLHPTQGQLNAVKAREFADNMPEKALKKPVIVSKDDYILDGHHRWAALFLKDPESKIKSIDVDLPMKQLLAVARSFEKVGYKDVSEMRVKVARLRGMLG